jgi:hypothetical protein
MFDASPNDPTITTNLGFDTSRERSSDPSIYKHHRDKPAVLKKRSIASRNIEKHRARRNTPLIKAARISARCHPYEYRESVELWAVN